MSGMIDDKGMKWFDCRAEGCGAKVGFIKHKVTGKLMPVSDKLITVVTVDGQVIRGYEPHWATCKGGGSFRKRDKGKDDPDRD